MTTLIFSAKPSYTRALLPHLPSDLLEGETFVVHMLLTGPARMHFTRGRALKEYPLILEPRYQLDSSARFYAMPIKAYASSEAYGAAKAIPVTDLAPNVNRIIYADNPDHTGIWAFRSGLTLWFGKKAFQQTYESWSPFALDDESIRKAISGGNTTDDFDKLYDYAKTKRYFEFQWANNAHVVLGAAMRAVDVPGNLIPSKFGLQLLYAMREGLGPEYAPGTLGTDGQTIIHMQKWTGSGKYKIGKLGSTTSMSTILEQLAASGLIARKGTNLFISEKGSALLEALHPDCKDLDLPQRLDAWGMAGFDKSKQSIDKYIRTVFGKQLRFASKNASSNRSGQSLSQPRP